MTEEYFHFTLGPVQGFIAQARRTRDFWAGSFLLSWLSAVAIKACQSQGATILFPIPDHAFMQALEGRAPAQFPNQGCIPNRFKASVPVPADFNPDLVIEAVNTTWIALGQHIWDKDLSTLHPPPSSKTKEIWDEQLGGFWEASWALVTDVSEHAAMDRRKGWRSHFPPTQPGVKCDLMDGWQELSGEDRPNTKRQNEALWTRLRGSQKTLTADLKDGESLCAMAYVKRRFARHFSDFSAQLPEGTSVYGWKVPTAVPSVSYMAAVHWIRRLLSSDLLDQNSLSSYHRAAADLVDGSYGEWQTNLRCLRDCKADTLFRRIASIDGQVFFDFMLENPNNFPDQHQAGITARYLRALQKGCKLEAPSPFYALLVMDGDQLGIQMSTTKNQKFISQGLQNFTNAVREVVDENNGFLIYAGGDDVLAVLPMDDALKCAAQIRRSYSKEFPIDGSIKTSISAAVVYAHIGTPLAKLIATGHQLLDNIAKAKTGRDSLAVEVHKPGGCQLRWSLPWARALNDEGEVKLEEFATVFANGIAENAGDFSNKFFFAIRDRIGMLSNEGKGGAMFDHDTAVDLLATIYLSAGHSDLSNIRPARARFKAARARIEPLYQQCRHYRRTATHVIEDLPIFSPDAALLARFLATKGVDA